MSQQQPEVHEGLEGVVAFATEIAEPDKEGSALRYRGVDIEDLVGRVPFEKVWGLLVDGSYEPGLPPAEPYNIAIHTGDVRADVQASVAMLAPMLGMGQTYDISDEQARLDLSRVAVMVLSYAAQSARGLGTPVVPQRVVDEGSTLAEKFLIRWKGETGPPARQGDRRLLELRRRARHERLHLHRPGHHLDRCGRGGSLLRSDRCDERPAARRRPVARARHDRRGREARRRRRRRTSRSCSTTASG